MFVILTKNFAVMFASWFSGAGFTKGLRLRLSQGLKSGADFTNGLKPGFGLKFKTLVLNSVKNVSVGLDLMDFIKGLSSWIC